jgi:hypothetical protein
MTWQESKGFLVLVVVTIKVKRFLSLFKEHTNKQNGRVEVNIPAQIHRLGP